MADAIEALIPRRIKLFRVHSMVERKVVRVSCLPCTCGNLEKMGALEVIQCWLREGAGYSEKLPK